MRQMSQVQTQLKTKEKENIEKVRTGGEIHKDYQNIRMIVPSVSKP